MKNTVTYQKTLPLLGHYDVVVLGGGPSGVCAAIEAARNGARVLLAEATGMLGGMATSGLVGPFMTSYDGSGERPVVGGIFREVCERLNSKGGAILPENTDAPSIHTSFIAQYHRHVTPIDSFLLQITLDEMVNEAGVKTMLYTRAADAICENGRIKGVVVAALEGLAVIEGDVFIDCTGNADVAFAAGVPTWKGEEQSGVPQPGTLMFEINGVDDERYTARPAHYPVKAYRTPQKGVYKVNHFHVFNTDAASSESMTKGHMEARRQVLDAYNILRTETPGFEECAIKDVASVLGIRESRHIEGRYKLTVSDIYSGRRFDDRIASYAFGMDVHPRDPSQSGNFKVKTASVYYIPYRSMLPMGCDNLIVAGKTVCCESQAAGGLRVMPCAMAIGQAAGAAAYISVSDKCAPCDVPTEKLHSLLLAHEAILD